ncbi:unnamed protein product [Pleuronectes platessa]|uniref:Uncharacterized protein n=1 Tax=Pleuronectes platessa TaxID=8262 RepID=A0A9N7TL27_PLEPL|nr:unnamed protein product [Pleuronectes platessa]
MAVAPDRRKTEAEGWEGERKRVREKGEREKEKKREREKVDKDQEKMRTETGKNEDEDDDDDEEEDEDAEEDEDEDETSLEKQTNTFLLLVRRSRSAPAVNYRLKHPSGKLMPCSKASQQQNSCDAAARQLHTGSDGFFFRLLLQDIQNPQERNQQQPSGGAELLPITARGRRDTSVHRGHGVTRQTPE